MFRKKLDESRVQIGVRVRESVKERLKSIASDKGTYPACVAERYIEDRWIVTGKHMLSI